MIIPVYNDFVRAIAANPGKVAATVATGSALDGVGGSTGSQPPEDIIVETHGVSFPVEADRPFSELRLHPYTPFEGILIVSSDRKRQWSSLQLNGSIAPTRPPEHSSSELNCSRSIDRLKVEMMATSLSSPNKVRHAVCAYLEYFTPLRLDKIVRN